MPGIFCLLIVSLPYLCVLLYQFCKVVEQAVLRSQEVKLVVPLLLLHQLREKLTAISGDKLGGQLHHIQIKGGDGGRIGHELKLRWRLLGYHAFMNHLRLNLRAQTHNLSAFNNRQISENFNMFLFP